MTGRNRKVLLANRPEGEPTESNFTMTETDVPETGDGDVLVRTLYLSVDPYMRARMSDMIDRVDPWDVGAPLRAQGIGRVIESAHRGFAPGDVVSGHFEWAEFNVQSGRHLTPVPTENVPASAALGVVGIPGRTAYFGMFDIADLTPGETVVVSAAAGAVGSIAGQIAKLVDCSVVGIAGSDRKVELLETEFGFDGGINYDGTDDLEAALSETCPDGIDVYFDNVGGEITDSAIANLAEDGRVVVCGQIALYNRVDEPTGPRHLPTVLSKNARIEAVLIRQYRHRREEATRWLSKYVDAGELTYRETITRGLENAPEAFLGLFEGENIGKQLVEVADPDGV